jgi:hypothetical protein
VKAEKALEFIDVPVEGRKSCGSAVPGGAATTLVASSCGRPWYSEALPFTCTKSPTLTEGSTASASQTMQSSVPLRSLNLSLKYGLPALVVRVSLLESRNTVFTAVPATKSATEGRVRPSGRWA